MIKDSNVILFAFTGFTLKQNSKSITLIGLFAVAVFVSKTVLPSPVDKMIIIVQAIFLALGSLLFRFGATSVAILGAFLTILLRPSFAPFTIAFAIIYGLITDMLVSVLKVKSQGGNVLSHRLIAATTISTGVTGIISYYTTVHILLLLPRNPILEILILSLGMVSGMLGGWIAALTWKKLNKHMLSTLIQYDAS